MNYYKLSFCTVCMNRTEHLKQTLIRNIRDNIDYPQLEFVLLNYGSKDDLHEWVMNELAEYLATGTLQYYKADFPELFKMSHSKNMAFRLATGDVLISVDADNYTGAGFAQYVNRWFHRSEQLFLAPPWTDVGRKWWDVQGRLCLRTSHFAQFHGYDETIIDYGFEDQDLKHRMIQSGIRKTVIRNVQYLSAIQHTNALRVQSGITRKLMATMLLRAGERTGWELWYLRTDNRFERFKVIAPTISIQTPPLMDSLPGAHPCTVRLTDLKTGAYQASHRGITFLSHQGKVIDELTHESATELTAATGTAFYRLQPGELMDQLLLGRSCFLGRQRLLHNRKHQNKVNPLGYGKGLLTHWPEGRVVQLD
ncbi:glycosyltransferase family A protein [Paraflavitalea pollutisoli]|uniref:glycosyltransferase family A protein n=1 Tax=Paraflavitalea pollutisoli TaxID=3034143 RepID=UPI0023ED0499|nr:glycosyltransferase family A protein [Paraflavitalea sp. H1-2-19X]